MTDDDETRPSDKDTPLPSEDGRAAFPWTFEVADAERIWLGTQVRPWRSLAVVPCCDGLSTYEVARLLTVLGTQHGESIDLADVRDIPLQRVNAVLTLARSLVGRGDRVVFATRSIEENIAAVSCARAADCVVLCVRLGATSIGMVEETIRLIGRERCIGSILLRRHGPAAAGAERAPRVPRLEVAS